VHPVRRRAHGERGRSACGRWSGGGVVSTPQDRHHPLPAGTTRRGPVRLAGHGVDPAPGVRLAPVPPPVPGPLGAKLRTAACPRRSRRAGGARVPTPRWSLRRKPQFARTQDTWT